MLKFLKKYLYPKERASSSKALAVPVLEQSSATLVPWTPPIKRVSPLEKHLSGLLERARTYSVERSVFDEENRRLNGLDFGELIRRVSDKIDVPYGGASFYPLYHEIPKKAYSDWLQMREDGFTAQPLPEVGSFVEVMEAELLISDDTKNKWWAVRDSVEILPQYRNDNFAQVFRFKDPDIACQYLLGAGGKVKKDQLWGVLHRDVDDLNESLSSGWQIKLSNLNKSSGNYKVIAYNIGVATQTQRDITSGELEEKVSPLIFDKVFGYEPIPQPELCDFLLENSGTNNYKYNVPFQLNHSLLFAMPTEAYRIYRDAQKSEFLFGSVKFLSLRGKDHCPLSYCETNRIWLMGEREGSYIPLACWDKE